MVTKARWFAALPLAVSAFALDTSKLRPTGYANDFAGALDSRSRAAIDRYCGNLERATGAQIAVVLVRSLEGEPIEDVAIRLFQEWGIGKKGTDEGLLLLLAIQDRKQRAEVGYGLEPVIPDGFAGGVLRGIRPILRQGDYGGAMLAAVQQFGERIAASKGVDLTGGRRKAPSGRGPVSWLPLPLVLLFLFIVFSIIGSRVGRGGRRGRRGRGSSFLAGMILGNLLGHGRTYRGSGWSGGGFGGTGGFGGFGGFGGGRSGGGGATGGW
jgi:uncharacterized protein